MPWKPIRYEYWTTLICIAYAMLSTSKSIHFLFVDMKRGWIHSTGLFFSPVFVLFLPNINTPSFSYTFFWGALSTLYSYWTSKIHQSRTRRWQQRRPKHRKKSEHNFSVGILILFTLINQKKKKKKERTNAKILFGIFFCVAFGNDFQLINGKCCRSQATVKKKRSMSQIAKKLCVFKRRN